MKKKKKENKDDRQNVKNLPESIFWFEDYILLYVDAIQLGQIVSGLRRNPVVVVKKESKLSDLDYWFVDCQKVLMKIKLKLAEMKQCVYRLVSKSERFDSVLRGKLVTE